MKSSDVAAAASSRWPSLALFAVSLVLLWQAGSLPWEGEFGPGAGQFPIVVAAACVVLGLVLAVKPGWQGTRPDPQDMAPMEASQKRTFACYVVGLLLLAAAPYLGFLVTALLVSIVVAWFGEGRRLRSALIFGLACGLVTVVGLGGLIGVDVPASAIDQALMRLVR